jgi:hypothetical protein
MVAATEQKQITLHNKIRDNIAENYREKGYNVTIEKTIGNRRVDIFAEKQGECLIIEVVHTHYSGVLDEKLFTQVKVSIPKQSDFMPEDVWTVEDEAKLKELRRRKARHMRDPIRKKQYGARPKKA